MYIELQSPAASGARAVWLPGDQDARGGGRVRAALSRLTVVTPYKQLQKPKN